MKMKKQKITKHHTVQEGKKQPLDLLKILALTYLYIPIILFFVTWLKPIIYIPTILLLVGFSIWKLLSKYDLKKLRPIDGNRNVTVISIIILFCLIVSLCILSGIGGFTAQTDDWQKHNVIFGDLVNSPWPIRYDFGEKPSVLVYYIGSYLVPAAIGKVFHSFQIASIAMVLWFSVGILIAMLLLYRSYGKKKIYNLFLIFILFMVFATFINPLFGIYKAWFPEISGNGVDWLSETVKIQYTSMINLLRWVPTQFVPTLVAVSLFLDNKKAYGNYIFICAPLILYSAFTFVGLATFMIIYYAINVKNATSPKKEAKQAISVCNVMGLVISLPLVAYIACNLFQVKPDSAKMSISAINYLKSPELFLTLVIFELTWIIWALLLRHNGSSRLLTTASVILFVLPLINMGNYNDLCMRASIPALIVIACLVIKNILNAWNKERFYAYILIGCLILCGSHSFRYYTDALNGLNFETPQYNNPFSTSQEYYESEENITLYQYLDFDPGRFSDHILQK